VHAGAGGALVKDHQLLALGETPERRGQRADIHGLCRDVEEMRQKPADFAKENTDELSALWDRYFEELLGGEAERMLLVHRRDIVEPVKIGQGLQIILVLDEFFRAAVEQADMGIGALDDLAVQFQHQPQHAVRRGMLRPKVEGEVANCGFDHDGAPL
jgi:hypothetical protein